MNLASFYLLHAVLILPLLSGLLMRFTYICLRTMWKMLLDILIFSSIEREINFFLNFKSSNHYLIQKPNLSIFRIDNSVIFE